MFDLACKAVTRVALAVSVLTTAAITVAQDTVMFNYQGRVKVNNTQFDGQGQFKFAIFSPDGKTLLWSHDGTGTDTAEPTTAITLQVSDGVFNILMGSNTMEPLNSTLFQNREPLKLRTWFNDGNHGFQALNPDHNLINVNLITSMTGSNDFVIYVNGTTGNDNNSGLHPQRAKKTIQGAVDIVPARVMANVTIDIADGTYPEEVLIYGINVKPGKTLKFQGDKAWTPADLNEPTVIITGADGTTTGVRNSAIDAVQCTGIEFYGLCVESAAGIGLSLKTGNYTVKNCMVRNNGSNGLNIGMQSNAEIYSSISRENGVHGIGVNTNSRCPFIIDCQSLSNVHSGLAVMDNSQVGLDGTGNFSQNGVHGILCINYSGVGCSNTYNGTVSQNKMYGIVAGWGGYYANFWGRNTVSGNLSGQQLTFSGGVTNW